jgi:hypothetical protein
VVFLYSIYPLSSNGQKGEFVSIFIGYILVKTKTLSVKIASVWT